VRERAECRRIKRVYNPRMLAPLLNRSYRHLFAAQVIALLGTGLATIALGLLAYDLAGQNASLVLGTVFTIKMLAYVSIAPIAGAFADRFNRRKLLVALDIVRAAAAISLPFVTAVWQVYILIFLLQSASAAFTPTFQATIPDVLPQEADYTKALSLSRLAYDLENILSPALAGALLVFLSYDALFLGTVFGFLASALLVGTVLLPKAEIPDRTGFYDRTTRGVRIYLATPRLRGLLALNLAAAAAGAMVLVNTPLLVREFLGKPESAVAWTLFAFGLGSMLAAVILPRLLERFFDRPVMLLGAALMLASLLGFEWIALSHGLTWTGLLLIWFCSGLGYAAVLTPAGRLLRRSSETADRPALFAAQFALSHLCWLLTYPLSGWLMTRFGPQAAVAGLAVLVSLGLTAAPLLWPRQAGSTAEH